ncbi:unnamed protein product [Ectocarpus sp. CCAP 1310/34]|nr:unnamed protein product [Ectocarpus sp. CCAP 1310/34]
MMRGATRNLEYVDGENFFSLQFRMFRGQRPDRDEQEKSGIPATSPILARAAEPWLFRQKVHTEVWRGKTFSANANTMTSVDLRCNQMLASFYLRPGVCFSR